MDRPQRSRLASTTSVKKKTKSFFEKQEDEDHYAIPDDSEFDDSNPTAFLPDNRKHLSLFKRNPDHVDIWRRKVADRFRDMLYLLKGHKHTATRKSLTELDEDYAVEEKDMAYFLERSEKLMLAPKVEGPNEVKYTGKQLRR